MYGVSKGGIVTWGNRGPCSSARTAVAATAAGVGRWPPPGAVKGTRGCSGADEARGVRPSRQAADERRLCCGHAHAHYEALHLDFTPHTALWPLQRILAMDVTNRVLQMLSPKYTHITKRCYKVTLKSMLVSVTF